MKNIYILFILILCLASYSTIKAEDIDIIKGNFSSGKNITLLKTFTASKGDIIDINLNVDHKRRGLNIYIKQHPGNFVIFDFEDKQTLNKNFIVPSDAIYEIYYGGEKVDFNLNIVNHTNIPNGPKLGDVVYVCIPDTSFASGYVDTKIGENYKLTPYKEKVMFSTTIENEQICTRDFFTGVDMMRLSIPGDKKDAYREQKLLSYTINLTCQSPTLYSKMQNAVKSSAEALPDYKDIIGGVSSKGIKKMNPKNKYDVVTDINKEQEKLDNIKEVISLSGEAANVASEGTSAENIASTVAFLMDGDEVTHTAINKGLDIIGAPREVSAIVDKVYEFPGTTELVQNAIDNLAPTINGSAWIDIKQQHLKSKPYYEFPEKAFYIKSALNFTENKGYLDVPGSPTAAENGLNLKAWNMTSGADRLFKVVPSRKYEGYYYIQSELPGAKPVVLDHKGGSFNLQKYGNDIHLWQKHNGTSQMFRFEHLGGGKFRIYNYNGYLLCFSGRKVDNGTQLEIWEDETVGGFNEWYLIDPTTKQPFIPQNTAGNSEVYEDVRTISAKGSTINKTVTLAKEDAPLNTDLSHVDLNVLIKKNGVECTAKLIIDAKYRVTDYTDVIRYKKLSDPVMTKDFWSAYKINYHYDIMFASQAKDHYKKISKKEYYNYNKPKSEIVDKGNLEQIERLKQYDILTTTTKQ